MTSDDHSRSVPDADAAYGIPLAEALAAQPVDPALIDQVEAAERRWIAAGSPQPTLDEILRVSGEAPRPSLETFDALRAARNAVTAAKIARLTGLLRAGSEEARWRIDPVFDPWDGPWKPEDWA